MLQEKFDTFSAFVDSGKQEIFVPQELMDYLHIFFVKGLRFDDNTKGRLGEELRKFADTLEEDYEDEHYQILKRSDLLYPIHIFDPFSRTNTVYWY